MLRLGNAQRSARSGALVAAILMAGLSVGLLTPDAALARPSVLSPGQMGGTVGMGGSLLGVRHFPDLGFELRAGLMTTDASATAFGFVTPNLHGGLVLGDMVIGASLEAGLIHVNPDGPFGRDFNTGFLGFVPFFEYWFGGEGLAPFVGAQFGPAITFPDSGDAEVLLTAGGLGGLHFFVGDSFSFGPTAEINFLYNSSNQRAGWEFVLGFSIRGWVGGGDVSTENEFVPQAAEPARESEPTPYEPAPAASEEPAENPEGGLE